MVADINAEVPLPTECMAQVNAWVDLHAHVREDALVGQLLWAPPAHGQPWVKIKVMTFSAGEEYEYMAKYIVVCNEAGTTYDSDGLHNRDISDTEGGSCKGSSSAPVAPVQGACDLWAEEDFADCRVAGCRVALPRRHFPRGHVHVIEEYSENGNFIVEREHQSRYY